MKVYKGEEALHMMPLLITSNIVLTVYLAYKKNSDYTDFITDNIAADKESFELLVRNLDKLLALMDRSVNETLVYKHNPDTAMDIKLLNKITKENSKELVEIKDAPINGIQNGLTMLYSMYKLEEIISLDNSYYVHFETTAIYLTILIEILYRTKDNARSVICTIPYDLVKGNTTIRKIDFVAKYNEALILLINLYYVHKFNKEVKNSITKFQHTDDGIELALLFNEKIKKDKNLKDYVQDKAVFLKGDEL